MCTRVHPFNLLVTLASENLNYHKIKETNAVGSINIKYISIIAWRDPLLGNDRETNNETTPLMENRFLICNDGTTKNEPQQRNGVFYAARAEML
jgi:hypothetical protein